MSRTSDTIGHIPASICIAYLDDAPHGHYEMAIEPQTASPYAKLSLAVLTMALADFATLATGGRVSRRGALAGIKPRRPMTAEVDVARAEAMAVELAENPTLAVYADVLGVDLTALVQGTLRRIIAGQELRFSVGEETDE
jgi:hypothetical protein